MANTTFSGPIRSESTLKTISKNATTGAITTQSSINSSGFASLDANKLGTEAGTGITGGTGTIYRSSVMRQGGIITTRILIDLTGLRSTASGDILGVDIDEIVYPFPKPRHQIEQKHMLIFKVTIHRSFCGMHALCQFFEGEGLKTDLVN